MKKFFSQMIVALFLCLCLQPFLPLHAASTNVLVVDDEGDGDYTSISMAVESSSPGDIIQIYSGQYSGPIDINHTITLEGISSEYGSGQDSGKPIISADEDVGVLISVEADFCTITGLSINPGIPMDEDYGNTGIALHSKQNIVSHCDIFVGNRGILAYIGRESSDCSGNNIHNNTISGFTAAIQIEGDDCIVKHNDISNNTFGVHIFDADDVVVEENNFKKSTIHAFVFWIPYSYNVYYSRPKNVVFDNNYYDNWQFPLPKPILRGFAPLLIPMVFCLLFDLHPVHDPYQFF